MLLRSVSIATETSFATSKGYIMSVNELESLAERLRRLVNEAHEFGHKRDMILMLVDELANDIQDEADELVSNMERVLCDE